MNPKNPFQGRWKVECQVVSPNGQWETFRNIVSSEDCIWSFQTKYSHSYTDPDERLYHGSLTEHFGIHAAVPATYCYLENAQRLYIERPDMTDQGYLQLHYKDILRVERTAKGFILYELRDDDDCSNDHCCRLIMKRVP